MAASGHQKRKADLKLVILGSASVGKTTLIHRYIDGRFQDAISTIGASFSLKQWGPYNVALWDTAGEERFAGLSSFYCRGAGAAILAFDITNNETFQQLRGRFLSLLQSADENCLYVVVGTKLDLVTPSSRRVSQQEGFLLCKELNGDKIQDLPYFETSSLTGHNVTRVFDYILNTLLPLKEGEQRYVRKHTPGVVDLDKHPKANEGAASQEKGKCC